MRAPRELFWMNDAKSGAGNLCEEDDPRKTCVAMHANEFKSDAEAKRLGIWDYLYGGGEGVQARNLRAEDPEAVNRKATDASKEVRAQALQTHSHRPSIEERAYVENAVGSGADVSPEERQVAGEMGGTFTGPTLPEQSRAGGYEPAAAHAQQQMGGGQVETPASRAQTGQEPPKSEEPKLPEPATGRTAPRKD